MDLNNPHLGPAEAEIEAAPRLNRLVARFVDMMLWFGPLMFIFLPCVGPVIALLAWLTLLIAQIWMLVTRAQTLGKRAINIYIIRTNGNIPHIGWLLVREFAIPVISGLLQYGGARHENPMDYLLLGLGSSLWLIDVLFIFGSTRRCLHDYMAGTHVVRTK